MGLSSALYSGTSGISAHGEKMSVIGNNLANVNTVGYKSSRMHFEDFMPQDINTSAGVGQVGRGVSVGAVMTEFQQGSLETTNESTDVAIGGNGFFVVSPTGSEENLYTRAGNFRFDKEGLLVDPHGNVVQGWEVRQDQAEVAEGEEVMETDSGVQTQGMYGDIRLENFQSPPEATDQVNMKVNLDSRSVDRSTAPLNQLSGQDAGGDNYLVFSTVGDFTDDNSNSIGDGVTMLVNEDDNNIVYTSPDTYPDPGADINPGAALTVELDDPGNNGVKTYNIQWDGESFRLVEPNISYDEEDADDSHLLHGHFAAENGLELKKFYEERNPFMAMFENWDANADVPLGDARYSYQTTLNVYDANGSSYELTTYYDPVRDPDVVASSGGDQYWEYMTTVKPNNDNRTHMEGSSKRGVLMTGTMTFNPAGDLIGQSAFTLNNDAALQDPVNLENWTPANFSQNGYPLFTANFLGEDDASFTSADDARNMEMNFGLRNRTGNWTAETVPVIDDYAAGTTTDEPNCAAYLNAWGTEGSFDASSVIPNFADDEREAMSTTQYSTSSTTMTQSQDGYTAGFLQNVSIDREGVLTGRYDNGQVLELYALTLADFHNTQGLRNEGGNLFSRTRRSGNERTGLAGSSGLGTISSNSLEQSNVDISEEFVKMIITEKGFQANSRTITTTDTMLQEVINLKR